MNAVTFLITGLGYGGAETQLVKVASRLKTRGWDVRIVSMIEPEAFVDELDSIGIEVSSLDMRRGIPNPFAVFKLVSILRRWKPDVLHSHMVHANLLARVSRLIYKVPVQVSTAHNIDEGRRWREIAYRMTEFLCDITTQVSEAGTQRYIEVGAVSKNKIRTVPNGVDTGCFRRNKESRKRLRQELDVADSFVWLAVGRFQEAKDYPNMVRAFAKLVKEQPNCILLLVGQGELRLAIEKQVSASGIGQNVRFLGVRTDIPQLMSAADAYVMSSAWEGMPIVLLEASASALPIVATDVGGNREVVMHEKSGFLTLAKDSDSLANAMLQVTGLTEHELCRMGGAARSNTEANYSLDRVVDIWEELYSEFLNTNFKRHATEEFKKIG